MIHKIKEIQLDIIVLLGSIHAPLLWREFNAYSLICQVVFEWRMEDSWHILGYCCVEISGFSYFCVSFKVYVSLNGCITLCFYEKEKFILCFVVGLWTSLRMRFRQCRYY